MKEDWDDIYTSVWWTSNNPSRSMLMGQGYPQCGGPMDVRSSFQSSIQVPVFGMLVWHTLCLWLGWWRWLIWASFCRQLAALLAMVPDGLGCDWGTVEALLTHQAQLVMCHLQMVDDSSLILPFLPTPWTVGYPFEMMEGIQDGGYWLGPWPSGTLRGTLVGRISTLLAGFLECSWHTAVCSTQSKSPWSHRFWSLVGWQIWSYSGKCLPCCKKSCCWSMGSFLSSNPPLPFAPIWNPCWRLPGDSLTRLYGGAFPPSTLNGGLLGSCFGGGFRWGQRLHPVRWVVSPLGLRWGPRHDCCGGRRSLWTGSFLLRGDTPGGMPAG